jgi:hypothetical protein
MKYTCRSIARLLGLAEKIAEVIARRKLSPVVKSVRPSVHLVDLLFLPFGDVHFKPARSGGEANLTKSLLCRELEFGGWRSHPSRREGLTTKVKVLA